MLEKIENVLLRAKSSQKRKKEEAKVNTNNAVSSVLPDAVFQKSDQIVFIFALSSLTLLSFFHLNRFSEDKSEQY